MFFCVVMIFGIINTSTTYNVIVTAHRGNCTFKKSSRKIFNGDVTRCSHDSTMAVCWRHVVLWLHSKFLKKYRFLVLNTSDDIWWSVDDITCIIEFLFNFSNTQKKSWLCAVNDFCNVGHDRTKFSVTTHDWDTTAIMTVVFVRKFCDLSFFCTNIF